MRFSALVMLACLVGCGGQDTSAESFQVVEIKPLPELGSLDLDELTAEQWERTCEWMVSAQGGSRTVDCVDGMMVTVESVEACSERTLRPQCAASQLIACVQARGDRVCGTEPLECIEYYECARTSKPVLTAMHTNL